MRGKDVRTAQNTLKKNKYGTFYNGEVDGEYGPLTGSATKDAKWMLGWKPNAAKSTAYGDALHNVLTGKVRLSKDQEARRKERLKNPPVIQKRKAMLRAAVAKIGMRESPANSNICAVSRWYGMTGPWCAMFVTKCGVEAGLQAFERGSRWAYCPYMVSDALNGRNGLRARGKSEAPQPGDIVLFDWGGDGTADHVGIFEKGTRSSFSCIEGNTAVGNDSNGGQVMRRQRSSSVRLFAYVVR
jgi:cell wall-associated NlpC family hydrolase